MEGGGCVYMSRMSPALSGSLSLLHIKLGDVLEIRDGIIFNFYPGLPHIRVLKQTVATNLGT